MRINILIILSQFHYIEKILKHFEMLECSPLSTPMDGSLKLLPHVSSLISEISHSKIIRSLMYAMTCIRPNIAYLVGEVNRFTSTLGPIMQWIAI